MGANVYLSKPNLHEQGCMASNRWMRALLMGLLFSLPHVGCAAIFKGTTEPVTITSTPSNVDVEINGVKIGRTPITTDLKSGDLHRVTFMVNGQPVQSSTIDYHVGWGWVVLDTLWLTVVPHLIDGITGAWHYLDETTVHADLSNLIAPPQPPVPPGYAPQPSWGYNAR